jgi:hypothetical protein
VTAARVPQWADQATEAGRDCHWIAKVAERLDLAADTPYAYAHRGELPFRVGRGRVGARYRMPKEPFDRWLGVVTPERSEPTRVVLSFEEAERLPAQLASAGGLRRFEQASPWLRGGQHDTGDLLAAAGLQRRLFDGRFAAGPAELVVQPLPPCPIAASRREVLPCL